METLNCDALTREASAYLSRALELGWRFRVVQNWGKGGWLLFLEFKTLVGGMPRRWGKKCFHLSGRLYVRGWFVRWEMPRNLLGQLAPACVALVLRGAVLWEPVPLDPWGAWLAPARPLFWGPLLSALFCPIPSHLARGRIHFNTNYQSFQETCIYSAGKTCSTNSACIFGRLNLILSYKKLQTHKNLQTQYCCVLLSESNNSSHQCLIAWLWYHL